MLLRASSLILLLVSAFACPFPAARAYTYLQTGVDSNLLVDDYRVLFAQADGSLTALSLETGDVLTRDLTRDFSGKLVRVAPGILLINSAQITLLDPRDFTPRWSTSFHHEPTVTQSNLVSSDGIGTVECRALEDGKLRWSFALPGTLDVVARGGKVLVHRPATYEDATPNVVTLLDESTGRELFRKIAPPGIHWERSFFDGTNVFVESGPYKTQRSDCVPDRLLVWNSSGEELRSIPIPTELLPALRHRQPFKLDQKTFWGGVAYAAGELIPLERGQANASLEYTNSQTRVFESDYTVGHGVFLVERSRYLMTTAADTNGAFTLELELITPTNRWYGVLPYLLDSGRLAAVAMAGDKLLIGTDHGQVECILATTGESLWLYSFPSLRRTASYSAGSLPPTLTEAAEIFKRLNADTPTSGFQLIDGKAAKTRVILDPAPANPYRDLGTRIAIAWSAAIVPLLLLVAAHAVPKIRRWGPAALGAFSAWMGFLLFCAYLFYGRVSPASSWSLQFAIALTLLTGTLHAVRCYQTGNRVEARILGISIIGVTLAILLAVV